MTDTEILTRFVIEPRCEYARSSKCWLVVWDSEANGYIKNGEGEHRHAMRRFSNSEEILDYIKDNY